LLVQQGPLPAVAAVETLPSGVTYEVLKKGDGPQPEIGELVAIRFAAYFGDRKIDDIFDTPEPYYTRLGSGGLLKGVETTLPLMRLGDRWKLTIPVRRHGSTFTLNLAESSKIHPCLCWHSFSPFCISNIAGTTRLWTQGKVRRRLLFNGRDTNPEISIAHMIFICDIINNSHLKHCISKPSDLLRPENLEFLLMQILLLMSKWLDFQGRNQN
jgi:hypothetical protein